MEQLVPSISMVITKKRPEGEFSGYTPVVKSAHKASKDGCHKRDLFSCTKTSAIAY